MSHLVHLHTVPFSLAVRRTDSSGVGWMIALASAGYDTLVAAALGLPTNLGVGWSWLFPLSSFKFLTRRSLKSQWVYLAPHEDNSIQLLSTARSRRWKTISWATWRYVDSLNSYWQYDQNCRCNHVPVVPFHDVRFHRAVAIVTEIYLCWWWVHVSMQTSHLSFQINAVKPTLVLTLMSPLFSSGCFGPKSWACLFCWAVLSHMNLFYICPSHQKVLGMKGNCP